MSGLLGCAYRRSSLCPRFPDVYIWKADAPFTPLSLLLALLGNTELHHAEDGISFRLGVGARELEHELKA